MTVTITVTPGTAAFNALHEALANRYLDLEGLLGDMEEDDDPVAWRRMLEERNAARELMRQLDRARQALAVDWSAGDRVAVEMEYGVQRTGTVMGQRPGRPAEWDVLLDDGRTCHTHWGHLRALGGGD